jgi:hypothetical protein
MPWLADIHDGSCWATGASTRQRTQRTHGLEQSRAHGRARSARARCRARANGRARA